ncbi:MAG: competence/damage-inducible protein A [bacterium]
MNNQLKRVVLLSTGDELMSGKIADTNAQWMADRFYTLGLEVAAVLTVGDFRERLVWAWEQAFAMGDLVISTGGIGPTADDLTTETLAGILGEELRFDEYTAERMRRLFEGMRRPMPENNLKQAWFPQSAVIVPNALGTAPGYRVSTEREVGGEQVMRHLVVLPGVPREMKRMFDETVIPWVVAQQGDAAPPVARTFQTFGMSESALDEAVAEVIPEGAARVSFRASFPKIGVTLLIRGEDAEARLEALSATLRERLGGAIYAEGETLMEQAAGEALRARGATVAVAESCSGGLIGSRLTDIPGSSEYFLADFVTYSNEAKQNVLGVPAAILDAHGAVSEETVRHMAEGARERAGSDIAVATSGIAGPGGGTEARPVGTVCFALATSEGTISHRHQLWGSRDWIKLLTSQIALDWIRRWAKGIDIRESGFRRR